jgi:hypothetical protein
MLDARMAQRTKQRLDEVKLTLERLQRIALDPSAADEPPPRAEGPASKTSPAVEMARLVRSANGSPDKATNKRTIALGAAAVTGVVAVAGLGVWMLSGTGTEPQQTAATAVDMPVRPPASPAPVSGAAPPLSGAAQPVAEAQTLLDGGKIADARRILIDVSPPSAEAALMLARSYDPNFLKQFAQPDADADPAEAERWYRTWHALAARNGLVMEPDRLERIIKAMK